MARIGSLTDVVDWGLCIGCGACAHACDKAEVAMWDLPDLGLRPKLDAEACANCQDCLSFCPGAGLDADTATGPRPRVSEADHEFGPVLEIWEGHAADPEIRFQASSGGATTALALYCLEREDMASVVHAGMDEEQPWLNAVAQSFDRSELIGRAGSRYAPSSPCAGLDRVEQSERPAVFIGKPCDVAAVQSLRKQRPELDEKLGLVLTFFCAGTPSTRATLDLLKANHVETDEMQRLRYRGEGWPGRFKAISSDGREECSLSYAESWGAINGYRSLRCHLCPDGLGRIADISCGDAWHRYDYQQDENPEQDRDGADPGRSIILVNTERGRAILRGAIEAGYLEVTRAGPDEVVEAQGLLDRRRQIFGRFVALRLLGRPVPRFVGFSLFRGWRKLPFKHQLLSIFGTLRRAFSKGWTRKQTIDWARPESDWQQRTPVKRSRPG